MNIVTMGMNRVRKLVVLGGFGEVTIHEKKETRKKPSQRSRKIRSTRLIHLKEKCEELVSRSQRRGADLIAIKLELVKVKRAIRRLEDRTKAESETPFIPYALPEDYKDHSGSRAIGVIWVGKRRKRSAH